MAGVRIHHPTETSCQFVLVDGNRPYRAPFDCSVCHRTHLFKTYHIRLDGLGFSIVSPEVWQRLVRIPGSPFVLSNEVERPPPQIISPFGEALAMRVTNG